ncbi:MAG: hypothetical protein AAFW84_30385 [Cyanobacteria bacterium J06635_15]
MMTVRNPDESKQTYLFKDLPKAAQVSYRGGDRADPNTYPWQLTLRAASKEPGDLPDILILDDDDDDDT